MMKAVVIEGADLQLRHDLPQREPAPEELQVRVHAAGVNFADLMRKPSHFGSSGRGPAIAGLEFAGVVAHRMRCSRLCSGRQGDGDGRRGLCRSRSRRSPPRVDAVGGAAAADNLAAAAIGARWITVGRVDGRSAQIGLNEFARKRLAEAVAAQDHMRSKRHFGKVVLRVAG